MSLRKVLTLILIVFSTYTFVNQYNLTENNEYLKARVNNLSEKENTLTTENTTLKATIIKSEQKLNNYAGKLISDSSLPVSKDILKKIEAAPISKKINEPANISKNSKVEEENQINDFVESTPTNENKKISVVPTAVAAMTDLKPQKNLTNILVYGVNGGLTDTLLVVSINKAAEKISLISIPRDYWSTKYRDKINRVYRKHGYDAFIGSIEDLLGLKVHRTFRVDFQSFIRIVDILGGIWIYNEYDILDNYYPTDDYKYQTFSLSAGYHHLDGETALKFARTRHGDSDFRRASRQQEVINGVYNALQRLNIGDITKVLKIVQEILSNVKTDITVFEGLQYASDYAKYSLNFGNVIQAPTQLYSDKNYYGEYILLPRDPTMTQIHNYIQDIVK